jgi:hypothetical protein
MGEAPCARQATVARERIRQRCVVQDVQILVAAQQKIH